MSTATGAPRGRIRRWIGAITLDFSPLRHRDLRLLLAGRYASFLGSQITVVTLAFQVYDLTHSSFAVGAIGACELVPILTVSLWAGALADVADRRRVMLVAEVIAATATGVLLANSMLTSPRVWVLFAMAVVASVGYALMRPAYDAAIPRLADRSEYGAVASIEGLLGSAAMIGGPAVAGLVLALSGAALAYWVDLATFVVMIGVAIALRPIPRSGVAERPSVRAIGAAIRYAARKPVLLGTYVVDEVAMVFGMPMAVFPALALHRYGGGGGVLGLLYAAPALGAAVASATSRWTARIHRHDWPS
jgi:MFS family permease